MQAAFDLLSLVQLQGDNLRGQWNKQDGAIVSPNAALEQTNLENRKRPAIVIPYELPTNYRLRMTIERKTGDGAIIFDVPTTRRNVEVGFYLATRFSGVDGIESTGTSYKQSSIVEPSSSFHEVNFTPSR